ncbi:MAG: glycosyltransferase [Bacteroidales bacterium]|jgi:glycosyltransferase involved in cell wall biosynthesis|nr:glycosyltransferase [Bacteroidales bacterium]
MPLLSIIIPNYNKELYVKETLQSVLMQSFFDWEIIIVDDGYDGSTDRSQKIIQTMSENDMKTLLLVTIGGLANRMYAILSAIAFCRDNNIKLKILWLKDRGMGADFTDIFISRTEIITPKWYHYLLYDSHRKRNLYILQLWQCLMFNGVHSKMSDIVYFFSDTKVFSFQVFVNPEFSYTFVLQKSRKIK